MIGLYGLGVSLLGALLFLFAVSLLAAIVRGVIGWGAFRLAVISAALWAALQVAPILRAIVAPSSDLIPLVAESEGAPSA